MSSTIRIPHPLLPAALGQTIEIPGDWAWQPGELRSYLVHYTAYRDGRLDRFGSAEAWAHSPEEATELVRKLATEDGLTLGDLRPVETGPVVYAVELGAFVKRKRWQPGWALAFL